MDTDIRITDIFIRANDLGMWHFYFDTKKNEDDTLSVHAHQGWWNYQKDSRKSS